MKLSKRLTALDEMITQRYDHIWDCCCDHGFLGMQLLNRNSAQKVHFIDQVPELMAKLNLEMQKHFSDELFVNETFGKRWQLYSQDVKTLKLPLESHQQKHLLIIAGVGGERVLELVKAIDKQHPQLNLEFLLCPVGHIYFLRQGLATMDYQLIDEKLMQENGRFYELIHIGKDSNEPIATVGSKLWDLTREPDKRYLERNLHHFKLKAESIGGDYEKIYSAYQKISLVE